MNIAVVRFLAASGVPPYVVQLDEFKDLVRSIQAAPNAKVGCRQSFAQGRRGAAGTWLQMALDEAKTGRDKMLRDIEAGPAWAGASSPHAPSSLPHYLPQDPSEAPSLPPLSRYGGYAAGESIDVEIVSFSSSGSLSHASAPTASQHDTVELSAACAGSSTQFHALHTKFFDALRCTPHRKLKNCRVHALRIGEPAR
jgi:hypothetical protein